MCVLVIRLLFKNTDLLSLENQSYNLISHQSSLKSSPPIKTKTKLAQILRLQIWLKGWTFASRVLGRLSSKMSGEKSRSI